MQKDLQTKRSQSSVNNKIVADKYKPRKSDLPNAMTPMMSLNLPKNRNMTLVDGSLMMAAGGAKVTRGMSAQYSPQFKSSANIDSRKDSQECSSSSSDEHDRDIERN